jgi:hypothetical protein
MTRQRTVLVTALSVAVTTAVGLTLALGGHPGRVGATADATPQDATQTHALPVRDTAPPAVASTSSDLLYHNGPVIGSSSTFAIFWEPLSLQDGSPATVSSGYNDLIMRYFQDVGGSGLYNNNTQYCDTTGCPGNSSELATNVGTAGTGGPGFAIDRAPYPKAKCVNHAAPHNCLTDAQVRAEFQQFVGAPQLNVEFFIYLAEGEGSCLAKASCAFTQYCAYHGHFTANGVEVTYAVIPYAVPHPGCLPSTPNAPNDLDADAAINLTSRMQMDMVTDPLLNAWYDSAGQEIGDKCSFQFGAVNLDNNQANVQWNSHYYVVQQEWSNHAVANTGNGCVLSGP